MSTLTRRTLVAALAGSALLAACSPAADSATTPSPPPASSAAASASGPITITDQAGRQVTLKAPAKKVFGAGPPATVVIYSLNPDALAGWNTKLAASAEPYLKNGAANKPVLGRVTGGKDTFNPEVLNANGVDLIVDAGDINDAYRKSNDDLTAKTGIPVIMLSTDPARLAEGYEILGKATGMSERAGVLAKEVTRISKLVSDGAAKVGDKALVYYAKSAKGLSTAQSGSINARVIDAIGATNAAGTTTKSGRINVTAEQILAYRPTHVVISPDSPTDAIATNPASVEPFAGLTAIKDGKYIVVPNNMPFGWFDGPPSVNQLLGMMWAGESIYPDAFDVDLIKETRSFYSVFFHHDLSEAEAKKFLTDAHTPGF